MAFLFQDNRAHTTHIAGTFNDPDLNSANGGVQQREQIFDHNVLSQRVPREPVFEKFRRDDIGLMHGTHDYLMVHSYRFAQPSREIGRWADIARE